MRQCLEPWERNRTSHALGHSKSPIPSRLNPFLCLIIHIDLVFDSSIHVYNMFCSSSPRASLLPLLLPSPLPSPITLSGLSVLFLSLLHGPLFSGRVAHMGTGIDLCIWAGAVHQWPQPWRQWLSQLHQPLTVISSPGWGCEPDSEISIFLFPFPSLPM